MSTGLEELITEHFGVSVEELTSALDTLPPIRPDAASLSESEAARTMTRRQPVLMPR